MGGRRGSGPPVQDHLILTDGDGRVVLDSEGERVDQILAPDDLTRGAPITVDGERVGTLLVVATETGAAAALADDFLAALNRGVLLAAVTAGLMALLLGAVLVRQIIAPLRGLQEAARAIADGDLSRRVMITSQDEIGDVGHSFNQMAVALEHNERVRRHTMADIAHELRTPLTVIQGQLEALLDGVFPLTAEQLAPIHDETLLLARLVADLRELALAEAGRLTIERSPVHLDDAVRRVATAVEPAASEKGIALGVDIAPNLSAACADADRLSQVLHNLLGNALRHTPSGGRVGISVQAFSPSELLVSVTDTGPGIPPADVPYIFDRFYRADKSRSRAGGGSGLGLTIARHIIESHGGRIWARSQLDEGTCIKFTLPIANSDSGTSREGFRVSET